MLDRARRNAIAGLPVAIVALLLVASRLRPGYFLDPTYLAGMIFAVVLLLCLWAYDRLFFALLMVTFLWAGIEVPMRNAWTSGRWAVLAAGAIVGLVHWIRTGVQRYQLFHLVAAFCAVSAMISALVSAAPQVSFLKALSLLLLFLYGASGARLILRNPDSLFRWLLMACEASVYISVFCYLVLGIEFWGNQNSLGAVEGMVAAPLLLWGAMVATQKSMRVRRAIACVGALYLVYDSITRAAMLACAISMLALLIGLRRHRLIWRSAVAVLGIVALTAVFVPGRFDEYKSSLISGVIYKGHEDQGLLGSRLTPWEETVRVIQQNPYLGSGFGTGLSGDQAFGEVRQVSSTAVLREHGSSYLAIADYVGLLGLLPFALLIALLVRAAGRVFFWLRRTGNAQHYSVPVMMVIVAGLVHAGFEDWMFAVGFYLTVLFWTLGFLLMDLVPDTATSYSTVFHGMRFRYTARPEFAQH